MMIIRYKIIKKSTVVLIRVCYKVTTQVHNYMYERNSYFIKICFFKFFSQKYLTYGISLNEMLYFRWHLPPPPPAILMNVMSFLQIKEKKILVKYKNSLVNYFRFCTSNEILIFCLNWSLSHLTVPRCFFDKINPKTINIQSMNKYR